VPLQSFQEVNIYVKVPPGTKSKQLYCEISNTHLRFGLVNNPPYLDKDLAGTVKEPLWTLEDSTLHITLQKQQQVRGNTCMSSKGELMGLSLTNHVSLIQFSRSWVGVGVKQIASYFIRPIHFGVQSCIQGLAEEESWEREFKLAGHLSVTLYW